MSLTLPERFRSAVFGSLRLAFRLMPISEANRDRWRHRFLGRFPGLVPSGPRGQGGKCDVARRARMRSDQQALGHVSYRRQVLPSPLPATLVAFPRAPLRAGGENDVWWRAGLTGGRKAARALS